MPFPFDAAAGGAASPSRRRFVQGLAAGGAMVAFGARAAAGLTPPPRVPELRGREFDLVIGETPVDFTGRARTAVTVNGSLPAPTLRMRQGDAVTLRVRNALAANSVHGHETSLHWHGILLPANMDGVPGLSFDGIHRGESYVYRFDVRQAGTYWYHSHSAFQEQAGLYGALIIDPVDPEPFAYQREHVVLLSDWTDLDPAALFARLKRMPGHDNVYRRTVGDFARDASNDGLRATLADRGMWGRMRMTPSDLSDVNANTYTYLMNGTTGPGNWTGLFAPGETVRLRFINGASMTYFDVRIPGLEMTVVAVDGQYVHPVTVDEFRMAAAETVDVLVTPRGQDAYTIFAQDSARTGFVSGTLAVRDRLRAPVPMLDPRPILTMADMAHGAMAGMGHTQHAAAPASPDMAGMDHSMHAMPGMDHSQHAMPGMQHDAASTAPVHPPGERGNPLVDMQSMAPTSRLDDPGFGLRDNGRRVLRYSMLRSLFADPDGREPGRSVELHLTGHMERFAWSFDGTKFSNSAPLQLKYGERLRVVLVNDTMMSHPIHLHGMWSDVEDDNGDFMVRKHTVDMPPGSRRSYRVRADALGRWAYHCHLLYHMESGMMRTVEVRE